MITARFRKVIGVKKQDLLEMKLKEELKKDKLKVDFLFGMRSMDIFIEFPNYDIFKKHYLKIKKKLE